MRESWGKIWICNLRCGTAIKYLCYSLINANLVNIEPTKLELMHLLLQSQKESLLAKVKKVLNEEHTDWWDDKDTEEKQEVEKGLSEADKEILPKI